LTLGNAVAETFGYDANRLQLTSHVATKSGGPAGGLMNVTYGYQASAEQMGAGSTAGNAGQLMAISGTINSTAESAGYSYDNLGRLVTSDQTSNGSSAQRRFAYDRWGNRTGVWDRVAGGSPIQSVALQQSSGSPTNQIQTVYPQETNFALPSNGATAVASSTFDTSYPASGAINGDRKGTNWGDGGGWMGESKTSPDWLEVDFSGAKTIDEIDVFTVQDNYTNPGEPTENMTFNQYGIVDFEVQYWKAGSGWVTVTGGNVTGNNKVWKKLTFAQITTSKIRVNITNALGYARVTELEAWGPNPGVNYAYDAAGNVTNDGVHTYQYDAENRLVCVDSGATAQYRYDHQNRRVSKIIGSSWTHYVWQGWQVIGEHDAATAYTTNPTYQMSSARLDYVYSGSRRIYSRERASSGGSWTTKYYLSDRLSTRLVLDTSGNVLGRQGHLPYGEDFGESGTPDKHRFTTYERDSESGSDYAINRRYAESAGRFMQVDPLEGSITSPQNLHRYAYVQNDPTNLVDPMGLEAFSPWPGDRPFECLIYPILCEPFPISENERPRPTKPPRRWAGFDNDSIGRIVAARNLGIRLLFGFEGNLNIDDSCLINLGRAGIDGAAVASILESLRIKPNTADETVPGDFDVLNGGESTLMTDFRRRNPSVPAAVAREPGGTFMYLFRIFHQGGPSNRGIRYERSRAVVLIHEAIHLSGFRDTDFGPDQVTGSHNLSTLIIKSCIDKNKDVSHLSIVPE
jgi:RHS repeat-associated protein